MRSFVLGMGMLGLVAASFGCGTGYIQFVERNGGPPGAPTADIKVLDIDCVDQFDETGGKTVLGSNAGNYAVSCTYEGKPLPWPILGEFHAAPVASGNWDRYRKKVTDKARNLGCPAIAIRRSPPTENQEGEAIGAFCVSASAALARGEMPAGATWAGKWDTSFGPLVLEDKGDAGVIGAYQYVNSGTKVIGVLKGRMQGNALEFEWLEQEGGAGNGHGTFIMGADGNSFEGTWGTGASSTSGGVWRGTRM